MVDKKEGIKRYLNLYKLALKMDFAWLFRNFKTAILAIFSDIITCMASSISMFFVAWRFENIGGLDKYEVLFMLAYNTIVLGIYGVLFEGENIGHISRKIGRGQLEHMLIQPLSLKAQILTTGFLPITGLGKLVSGLILLGIALPNITIDINILWCIKFIFSIVVADVLLISIMYLFSVVAFYAPFAGEEITHYVYNMIGEVSTFPINNMSKTIQIALITVVPTGLISWFPATQLLEKMPLQISGLYPLLATIIVFTLAKILFKKGMNHYVKYGINRYSKIGHRS